MMYASKEIPHRVFGTDKTASVDGKTEPCCSMAAEASRVLDDNNLLREIIVLIGFPTTLMCAALVCKRWYNHASDPAFLRRFRKLHPPRLLGFYVDYGPYSVPTTPCFVPMPLQAPELAAVVRRVSSYSFSHHDLVRIENCQNGIISTSLFSYKSGRSEGMHSPLCPEKDTFFSLPRIKDWDPVYYHIVAREKGDGGLSHFYVCMECARWTMDFIVQVYMLQDGAWYKHTSAMIKLTRRPRCETKAVLANNKIYLLADLTDIIIMDLTNSSLSTIQFPQGLEYGFSDIVLSRADDSSDVYLIHAKGLQLLIWLHKGDCWFAVDTICLRKLDHSLEDEHIDQASCVGDNAEFVFLRMGRCTFYLDIKSRTLGKVHERTDDYMKPATLHLFMMIWPPTFPAFKDDPTRNTM